MYLISACLAGEPCRMDGRAKPVPEIQALVSWHLHAAETR